MTFIPSMVALASHKGLHQGWLWPGLGNYKGDKNPGGVRVGQNNHELTATMEGLVFLSHPSSAPLPDKSILAWTLFTEWRNSLCLATNLGQTQDTAHFHCFDLA